jgi:hypothetical protein
MTQITGEYYVQFSGSYPNQSAYVRVKQVNQTTPNYFDNNGTPKPIYRIYTFSASGVFGDAKGIIFLQVLLQHIMKIFQTQIFKD